MFRYQQIFIEILHAKKQAKKQVFEVFGTDKVRLTWRFMNIFYFYAISGWKNIYFLSTYQHFCNWNQFRRQPSYCFEFRIVNSKFHIYSNWEFFRRVLLVRLKKNWLENWRCGGCLTNFYLYIYFYLFIYFFCEYLILLMPVKKMILVVWYLFCKL